HDTFTDKRTHLCRFCLLPPPPPTSPLFPYTTLFRSGLRRLTRDQDHLAAHPAQHGAAVDRAGDVRDGVGDPDRGRALLPRRRRRSEEHTSELQSRGHLVCRLLLEKKK